ncbi:hypothetical protein BGZ76_003572 [Entomortierella beljakovae]|nr:hypothetical protein BGZ76_003572 [Entomortierella beljakovae]
MSTPGVVHQIPVDQIDFSPNISSDAENFFQSDADIARMAARQGMVNYDKGQAIKISSKILGMCLGLKPFKGSLVTSDDGSASTTTTGTTATDEDSVTEKPIELEDKALIGTTAFLAESGHVARKINLATGKTIKLFHGHTGPVTCVTVYLNHLGQERLITGAWDKTIRVWDTETKECLATLRGHLDFVKALAVRTVYSKAEGDEKKRISHELFSASSDSTILHWDLETFQPFKDGAGGPWKGHSRGINDLCIALEDGNESNNNGTEDLGDKAYLYSAGSDGTIRKWDITRGQGRGGHCVKVLKHHDTSVYKLIVDSAEIWSVSADKTARRLDLETNKVDTTLVHPDFVKSIVLAGPYVITGGRQETVRVWSIATGKLIKEIKGHFDEVSGMAVIGTTLFTASLDATIRRWSLKEKDLNPPLPKDIDSISQSLSRSSVTNVSTSSSKEPEASKESSTPNVMTEEEERELAELMGSDFEDD